MLVNRVQRNESNNFLRGAYKNMGKSGYSDWLYIMKLISTRYMSLLLLS